MSDKLSWSGGIDVVCRGDEYERGFHQGSKLKDKIFDGVELCLREPDFRREQPWWLPYPIFRWLSKWKAHSLMSGPLKRDYPGMADRLAGIAKGSKLDLKTIYLVNAFEPMLSFISDVEIPSISACSAIAVAPKRSAMNKPMVARNFDYERSVEPYIIVRESRPSRGFRSIEMTLAPMAGSVDGINEKGLCVVNNYGYTTDHAAPSGTMTMLISETLARCATVEEAVKLMSSRPRWGGGLIMLADATGDIASLEISSTRFQVRRDTAGQGVLFHSNCFQTPEMRQVQVDDRALFSADTHPLKGRRVLQSAEKRYARMGELLARYEFLTPTTLTSILADHGPQGTDGEDTLCVHGAKSSTIASIQYYPKDRMMRMSTGAACEAKHILLGL